MLRTAMPRGWDSLQKSCFEAGIIETVVNLTQNTRSDLVVISYKSLFVITHLARAGTIAERRKLHEKVIKLKVLNICLDVSSCCSFNI